MRKHRVLYLAAASRGSSELALGAEGAAIQLELDRSTRRRRFQLVTRWAAEPHDLLRELRRVKPTIVHFSGHGAPAAGDPGGAPDAIRRDVGDERQGGLVFPGSDRAAQLVPAEALQRTFGAAGESVRLVVLNACYSDDHAELLLAHVECVVGMRGSIPDGAARDFAIGFYGGLCGGESIAAAFRQGCAAIGLARLRDADRPRLQSRPGVDAERLVLAAQPALRAPRPPDAPGLARPAQILDACRRSGAWVEDRLGRTALAFTCAGVLGFKLAPWLLPHLVSSYARSVFLALLVLGGLAGGAHLLGRYFDFDAAGHARDGAATGAVAAIAGVVMSLRSAPGIEIGIRLGAACLVTMIPTGALWALLTGAAHGRGRWPGRFASYLLVMVTLAGAWGAVIASVAPAARTLGSLPITLPIMAVMFAAFVLLFTAVTSRRQGRPATHTATAVVMAALLLALSYAAGATIAHLEFYDDLAGRVTLAAIIAALTILCVAILRVSYLAGAALARRST